MTISNTTESLIHEALYRVDLNSTFFEAINSPKPDKIESLKQVFNSAKREVFNTYRGYWTVAYCELPTDPSLDLGWYRAPADLIDWWVPVPDAAGYDDKGRPIYRLIYSQIKYIYDREDLSNVPTQVIEHIKLNFLRAMSTTAQFSPEKVARVDKMFQESDGALARFWKESIKIQLKRGPRRFSR